MQFDIRRDFLDGIMLQQPQSKNEKAEIKAGGQLHFLPSSPDGTMHTAIVSFALTLDEKAPPFAQGGWRFLFTSDEKFDPKTEPNHPFFGNLLVVGAGKIMAQVNNLAMHAGLPLIPFEPQRMVLGQGQGQAAPAPEAAAKPA
jgi:hypothetical protein